MHGKETKTNRNCIHRSDSQLQDISLNGIHRLYIVILDTVLCRAIVLHHMPWYFNTLNVPGLF